MSSTWSRWRRPWTDGGWAPWVRDLAGECGVYVIRDEEEQAVIYVGESHTFRLYETLTRHFQEWTSRSNRTYDRIGVEIKILVTGPDEDQALQLIEIQRLQDAGEDLDNRQDGRSYLDDDDPDDVPF